MQKVISQSNRSTYRHRLSSPLSCARDWSYPSYQGRPMLPVSWQLSHRNDLRGKASLRIRPSRLEASALKWSAAQLQTTSPHCRMTVPRSKGMTPRVLLHRNLSLSYPLHQPHFSAIPPSQNLSLEPTRHLRTRIGCRNRFDLRSNRKKVNILSNRFDRGGVRCSTIQSWRYRWRRRHSFLSSRIRRTRMTSLWVLLLCRRRARKSNVGLFQRVIISVHLESLLKDYELSALYYSFLARVEVFENFLATRTTFSSVTLPRLQTSIAAQQWIFTPSPANKWQFQLDRRQDPLRILWNLSRRPTTS